MGAKSLARPATSLYDQDFVIWTEETARLLREAKFGRIDIEQVAEEIEDMGKNYRHEVHSRLVVLIHHLLKWRYQPEKRSGSWKATIVTQRRDLASRFEQAPSLRRILREKLPAVYSDAVEEAAAETGLPESHFPGGCPFSEQEILDRQFFPER